MAGIQIDGVNNKIDFDDDLDTSISANTDDTLVIEAGGNTMATITATTFTINDGTTITTADNTDTLTLVSTDADALVGPNLNFYRNSSSPADGDLMGQIKFTGESAGSGIHTYGSIVMENNGVTDGQEQGKIKFNISMPDGALANVFNIDRTEICINEDSEDLDFRVESNANTHMLFVDGGNNRISMGDESPSNCGAIVTVSSGDSGATVNGTWDAFCIEGGGSRGMSILTPNDQTGAIVFGDPDDNDIGKFQYSHAENSMTFVVNAAERMRIASDGDIVLDAGNIDSSSNDLIIYSTASGHTGLRFGDGFTGPTNNAGSSSDGANALGAAAYRWAAVYAVNGAIQTSDRNEKQDIEELTDAEKRVAVVAKGLLRKYKFKDAVEKKGDKARTHFGIIAQDLEDAFTAEGLDASKYGMFCSDTWWETQTEVAAVEAVEEVTDEEGNVTTEAVEAKDAYTRTDTFEILEEAPEGATERTRLGVRYSELLAFIITVI